MTPLSPLKFLKRRRVIYQVIVGHVDLEERCVHVKANSHFRHVRNTVVGETQGRQRRCPRQPADDIAWCSCVSACGIKVDGSSSWPLTMNRDAQTWVTGVTGAAARDFVVAEIDELQLRVLTAGSIDDRTKPHVVYQIPAQVHRLQFVL